MPQTCQPSSARVAVIDDGGVVVKKITLVLAAGRGTVGIPVRAEAVVAVDRVLAACAVGARVGAALIEVVLARIAIPAIESDACGPLRVELKQGSAILPSAQPQHLARHTARHTARLPHIALCMLE